MVGFAIVKGFVLAAGLGTRLLPITNSIPKPLVPVGHIPLVGYALRLLSHHGITEVIVNTHHLKDELKAALGSGERFGVSIVYSEEEDILGTGGGLKKMHHLLEDDTFVVINSDILIDLDLGRVLDFHRRRGALATMVLREHPQEDTYGGIEVNDAGRIRRILGQGHQEEGLRSLMFTGVHILEPRFLEYIPPDVETCINRYAYMKALANDEKLYGFVTDGYWADAGTPTRYYNANIDALSQAMKLNHIDPLEGYALAPTKGGVEAVRMGNDVELGADVRLVPPVVLGDGTRIGDRATVGPYCVVGDNVNVGKDCELSHCIVMDGARIEPGETLAKMLLSKKHKLPVQ